jgi:DNA (cytosine-5)-methyltransferase 1
MSIVSPSIERTDALLREERRIYESRVGGTLSKKRKRFRLIDAFAGAGGMTLGFSSMFGHAFDPVWANDFNEDCVRTYDENFGAHCSSGDIVKLLKSRSLDIPIADVVIGGPPCQGFSLLNKQRDGDSRKALWRQYFEIVRRSEAKVFVMENVPQLLGSIEHAAITRTAKALGFEVASGVLRAPDYGVPQMRRRAFIIGSRTGSPSQVFPPKKTHFDPSRDEQLASMRTGSANGHLPGAVRWRTVRDVIADLPEPVGTEIRAVRPPLDLHFGRSPTPTSLARYRVLSEEGMNRFDLQRLAPDLTPACWIKKTSGGTDLFGRLWWDRPAFTIRTEFFKPEKGRYLHPVQDRPITHREAARLQSFPDAFRFAGTKIEVARQIGNAVPPLLSARVADVVYMLLTSTNT